MYSWANHTGNNVNVRIFIVMAVFTMTYFNVSIGSLHAIVY